MNISIATDLEGSVIESLADGEGIRLVVFTSGCPHHCIGCHNSKSWDVENGIRISTEQLADYILERYRRGSFSGITFSGGDPLFQTEELCELITLIRREVPDINIWCYTGYEYKDIAESQILPLIDVLVDGQFEEDKKFPRKKFRGSYNQKILYLDKGKIVREE